MLNFLKITVNMLLAQLEMRSWKQSENAHVPQGFTTMEGGNKRSDWRLRSFDENGPVALQSTAVASLGSIISSIHSPGSVTWTAQHRLFIVIALSMVTADSIAPTSTDTAFPPPPLFLIPFLCEDKGGWGSAAMEWVLSGEEDQETGGQSNGIMVDAMIDRKGIWSEIRAQAELLEAAS